MASKNLDCGISPAGVFAGLVTAVLLSSCSVRDVGEVSPGSATGGASGSGSDTIAIAGFWETNFGPYALISSVGGLTYIAEDPDVNCYNFNSHSLVSNGRNSETGVNQYTLVERVSEADDRVTVFTAFVQDDGILRLDTLGDNSTAVLYPAVTDFLPQDLNYCNTP